MKFMTSRDIPPLWVNRYLESYDFKGIINKMGEKVKGKGKPKKGARGSEFWLLKPSIVGIPTAGSMGGTYGGYRGGASPWL
jgi:hypothetical protein